MGIKLEEKITFLVSGFYEGGEAHLVEAFNQFLEEEIEKERDACAHLAENSSILHERNTPLSRIGKTIARAIRARKTP